MKTKRALLLLSVVALLASVFPIAPGHAAPVPEGATWTEVFFPSEDGTMLHADVLRPAHLSEKAKTPVILSIGPYFGSGGSLDSYDPDAQGPIDRFRDLWEGGDIFKRGYTWVQVDSRGFGSSGGCTDYGGPGEQMDVKAAVEWAATQPWSTGKVGMWGKSYDAWTQVMALAHKPKGLAAAVIQSPVLETYRIQYMNGIHYSVNWYLTPALYSVLYDLAPPSTADATPEEFAYSTAGTATNPHCYAENIVMTKVPLKDIPYWQERDIIAEAAKAKTPTLWSFGFLDANTKPDNFLPVYSKLRGPKTAWFGQYDHVRGNEVQFVGKDGFMDQAMRWFDHYLKGMPLAKAPVHKDPKVTVQQGDGKWRLESQWPPSDARYYSLPLAAGTYEDERTNTAATPTSGTWTFTQPMPYDVHFAGVPKLKVDVQTASPRANLIALVYSVSRDGTARLITRGALAVDGSKEVAFDLYPQDYRIPKGSRIGIFISGSDTSWFEPQVYSQLPVEVTGGSLSLPFLSFDRDEFVEGKAATAMLQWPVTSVDEGMIKEREKKAKLPPPMKEQR
ncbi:MAG TPA: CocE/NonD family hydrolase [Actinomycetota bacterium]|nr:CocE/NonD family hydrolase [Actinomycetota bacterium]